MSVPDAKALSPAPRSTIARSDPSSFAAAQMRANSSYIAKVRALRASGRLNVTQATSPRRSWRRSGMQRLRGLGDGARFEHRIDLRIAIAGFGQYLARVLAQERRGVMDRGRRPRE